MNASTPKNHKTQTKFELIEIHNVLYNILVEFDNFAKKHGISYSIFAGTLLGAVRHNDFIPWDDDIDLLVSEEDYSKIIKFQNNLPKHLKLQTKETDRSYDLPFAKLRDERTIVQEGEKNQGNFSGAFIDIFRMVLYTEKAKPIIDQITITRKHISNMQSIKKYTLKRILLSPVKKYAKLKLRALEIILDSFYLTHDLPKAKYISLPRQCQCVFWPIHFLYPITREFKFRSKKFPGPNKPHEFLTVHYGNYFSIPSPENRTSHLTYFKQKNNT